MFEGTSNFVNSVDTAFLVVLVISVAFLILITFLMIFFVIRYSRKKNPKAENIHGNIPLEITWTVIPTILVLVMFWFGWTGYKEMSEIPEDAYVIDVTGQMWQWKFKYENNIETDSLYAPVNKPIKLRLHSLDVNHAFFVPAFRVKKDVLPNRNNVTWFTANKTGEFEILCAEYCGLNHSYMLSKVIVMSNSDFNEWLKKASSGSVSTLSVSD